MTALPERRWLIVEDTPHFPGRIRKLLKETQRQPRRPDRGQDSRVSLTGSESCLTGRGCSNPVTRLSAPEAGQARPVPQLCHARRGGLPGCPAHARSHPYPANSQAAGAGGSGCGNQQCSRLGYFVTLAIDNVTTTPVDFLRVCAIMKLKPPVDGPGSVLPGIHPEVGTVDVLNGRPGSGHCRGHHPDAHGERLNGVHRWSVLEQARHPPEPRAGGAGDALLIDNDKPALDGGNSKKVEVVAEQLEEQPRDIDRVLEQMDHFRDTFAAAGMEADCQF